MSPRIWLTGRQRRMRREEAPAERAARQAALLRDYRDAFGSPSGRRVLADICERAGVARTTFAADPAVAAFNEGRRRLALEIIETINRDPEALVALFTAGEVASLFERQDA